MIRILLSAMLATASSQLLFAADSLDRTYLRLTVTLSDAEGERLVAGLQRGDFEVFYHGVPQFIEYFSAAPSPSSVVIILDMGGSMRSIDLSSTLGILTDICNTQAVPDEISLVAFSNQPAILKNFDWRVSDIDFEEVLGFLDRHNRKGECGLLQAIGMARERVQTQARNHNQAFVIITDVEDDFGFSAAMRSQDQIERMGLRVYGIFFPGEKRLDYGRLHNLVDLSGGRYFHVDEPDSLGLLIRWFLHELRYEYIIGFTPGKDPSDGERHGISVKLSQARSEPGISVRFTPTKTIGRTQNTGPPGS